jgi:hypothetical protein
VKFKSIAKASALAAAMSCASMAYAGPAVSGVRISDWAITVTDLDLADGVPASLNEDQSTWSNDLTTVAMVTGHSPPSPVSETRAGAQLHLDDTGIMGQAGGPGQSYNGSAVLLSADAELSRNTAVTFSLSYDLFGTVGSEASLLLDVSSICRVPPSGGWGHCLPAGRGISVRFDGSGDIGSDGLEHRSGSFNVSFVNQPDTFAGTLDDYLRLQYFVEVSARGFTTPVPEPETWTMLLGGLAGLTALRRRKSNPAV